MSSIEVEGKTLPTDEEGYLENLSDWEPAVATKRLVRSSVKNTVTASICTSYTRMGRQSRRVNMPVCQSPPAAFSATLFV